MMKQISKCKSCESFKVEKGKIGKCANGKSIYVDMLMLESDNACGYGTSKKSLVQDHVK